MLILVEGNIGKEPIEIAFVNIGTLGSNVVVARNLGNNALAASVSGKRRSFRGVGGVSRKRKKKIIMIKKGVVSEKNNNIKTVHFVHPSLYL